MFSFDMPFGLLYVSTYLSCVIESVQNVEKSGVKHNYRIGKIDLCTSASFLGILAFSRASRRRKRKIRVLQTQIVRQCCYGSGRGKETIFFFLKKTTRVPMLVALQLSTSTLFGRPTTGVQDSENHTHPAPLSPKSDVAKPSVRPSRQPRSPLTGTSILSPRATRSGPTCHSDANNFSRKKPITQFQKLKSILGRRD